jgi:hypothetical protein
MDRTTKLKSISSCDLTRGGQSVIILLVGQTSCTYHRIRSVPAVPIEADRSTEMQTRQVRSYHTCQIDPTDLSLRTKPKHLQVSTPNLKSKVDLLGVLTKSLCPLLQLVDTVYQRQSQTRERSTYDLLPRIPPPQCRRSSSDFSR